MHNIILFVSPPISLDGPVLSPKGSWKDHGTLVIEGDIVVFTGSIACSSVLDKKFKSGFFTTRIFVWREGKYIHARHIQTYAYNISSYENWRLSRLKHSNKNSGSRGPKNIDYLKHHHDKPVFSAGLHRARLPWDWRAPRVYRRRPRPPSCACTCWGRGHSDVDVGLAGRYPRHVYRSHTLPLARPWDTNIYNTSMRVADPTRYKNADPDSTFTWYKI